MSSAALEFLYYNIVLPPQLPHSADRNAENNNKALLDRLVQAACAFRYKPGSQFQSADFPSNFIKASGHPFKLPEFKPEAAQGLLYGVTLTFGKNGPADRNGTCVTVSFHSNFIKAVSVTQPKASGLVLLFYNLELKLNSTHFP